ncbi:hypothetical protein BUFA31_13540 [Butyricicoccus faecihominis]|uniref:Uncharacterized protein n=1 Tax=Butyricicoccus faecihominis TaxID=1712515 RepID=A0ABQ1DZP3_9FIRM|nr:hypothetical protein BUFA31_13540 [Butyricicoccus faecihominis]GGM62169.1 hypothetical protein GCM10007040_01600 [Butyricicoccus faecihominis]
MPENELRGTVMPRVAAIPAAVYGTTLRPEVVNRLRGSDAPKTGAETPQSQQAAPAPLSGGLATVRRAQTASPFIHLPLYKSLQILRK